MVIENKYGSRSYTTTMDQDDPQSSSENGADSPLSGDERATTAAPSPKKSRKSIQKRVVQVPIGDGDGSRSKAETYPPSDSWAWRKYGQKPIKGSPYPRGYYRCSSSKGCPARKQVERSRLDPSMLIITYASDHNHSLPASKHHHHHQPPATPPTPPPVSTPSTPSGPSDDVGEQPMTAVEINPFGDPPQLEFVGDSLVLNVGVEYDWISDLSFDGPAFVGPKCDYAEIVGFSMKEEDESLFGDLDELPECSTVFRRRQGGIQRCAPAPLCGRTS